MRQQKQNSAPDEQDNFAVFFKKIPSSQQTSSCKLRDITPPPNRFPTIAPKHPSSQVTSYKPETSYLLDAWTQQQENQPSEGVDPFDAGSPPELPAPKASYSIAGRTYLHEDWEGAHHPDADRAAMWNTKCFLEQELFQDYWRDCDRRGIYFEDTVMETPAGTSLYKGM